MTTYSIVVASVALALIVGLIMVDINDRVERREFNRECMKRLAAFEKALDDLRIIREDAHQEQDYFRRDKAQWAIDIIEKRLGIDGDEV